MYNLNGQKNVGSLARGLLHYFEQKKVSILNLGVLIGGKMKENLIPTDTRY
jgi:hypothetical protein